MTTLQLYRKEREYIMGLTNDEALTLAKQGFSAEEIKAFGWTPQSSYNEKQVGGTEETTADQKSEPGKNENTDGEGNSADNVSETIKTLTETVDSLTKTVKAMQENNQKTARKSKSDTAPKSADDVIKGFIENM